LSMATTTTGRPRGASRSAPARRTDRADAETRVGSSELPTATVSPIDSQTDRERWLVWAGHRSHAGPTSSRAARSCFGGYVRDQGGDYSAAGHTGCAPSAVARDRTVQEPPTPFHDYCHTRLEF
jgi:hypothetical protein